MSFRFSNSLCNTPLNTLGSEGNEKEKEESLPIKLDLDKTNVS